MGFFSVGLGSSSWVGGDVIFVDGGERWEEAFFDSIRGIGV